MKSTHNGDTDKIAERDTQLRSSHTSFKETYPAAAQPISGTAITAAAAHRKKLVYRSKQRGWLEVDLLLGSFAEECLGDVADEDLHQYEAILNLETIDIYNVISGQVELTENEDNEVLKMLRAYVDAGPIGIADPEKYAEKKQKMSN